MAGGIGKRIKKELSACDEFDPKRPCYYLLGWVNLRPPLDGYWELVSEKLLTHGECCEVIERGLEPFDKFLVVSTIEFNTLGLPNDREASEYFSLEKQREISFRNNSGPRKSKKYHEIVDEITDIK